jgi:hypothetical protein
MWERTTRLNFGVKAWLIHAPPPSEQGGTHDLVDVANRHCSHCRVRVGVLEEQAMKDSDYCLLLAIIVLAPHLSKGWALLMWAVFFTGFLFAIYLERFA